MSTESRGAGSVTLDTIIANALAEVRHKRLAADIGWETAWCDEPAETRERILERVQLAAEAVTDALLAKGTYYWTTDSRLVAQPEDGAWPVAVFRKDEPELRGEPQTPTHQPPRGADCR